MSEPFYYDDFEDDGPIEWADPAIRRNYEAALGRLILAHNEVDRNLTILIQRCLKELGDPTALKSMTTGNFASRLSNLGTIKELCPKLPLGGIDIDGLSTLNGERNVVAHGHFEQNPYDGDFVLIRAKQQFQDFSSHRLDKITEALGVQNGQMGAIIAFGFVPVM
ncbi:hypothetical protein [Brevundimonas sp.]|uniref:hypothetical protein n=1 Tax=Brevundimonas sp. TaxID=1871086 RepID=UPI002AB97B52|nr:hypothetical protein [Brevundimonas sp.]MDZ4362945.1 hypothetical protein [Brevundimonas sp.]